jgi:hypothetical protein
MTLSPRAAWLLVATNVGLLVALVATHVTARRTRFEELTAERINIVSPAGQTVIAISNKERIAAPVVGGTTYPVEVADGREHLAGMIFFNQDGDEMGGLVFNSFRQANGKAAGIGHLSFDRHGDNQVFALQYKENARTVQAGLTFYDRPADGRFKTSFDLLAEARAASPERRVEIQEALAAMKKDAGLGAERVFIGSRNRDAQVLLSDSKGRVRARLIVDAGDNARLEFLDAAGTVTARFPD